MKTWDVVIVGGGPAGSTAACLLARMGFEVLILEKDRFPRYHIGESMIPYCYYPLKRCGMISKLRKSKFTKKYSVQFIDPGGTASQPFYFLDYMKHPSAKTWQVWRDEFDCMLLDNAKEKGAKVKHHHTVKNFILKDDRVCGVKAVDKSGAPKEFHARMVIDASGRDGLAIRKFKWRVRDHKLDRVSIWTYFKGAVRDPGIDEGATTIAYLPEKGWYWYIPLMNDQVSVGLVAKQKYLYRGSRDLASIFERESQSNPWIADHIAQGKRCAKYLVTGEYSYRSKHCARDGLVLTGDAFAFLDPVFSSGLFLALKGGELVADATAAALKAGNTDASQFADYSRHLCHGIESMRKLVYAFYDKNFSFGKLLKAHPDCKSPVTDILIGDLFKNFDKLNTTLADFARIPKDLKHGGPLN